MADTSKSSGLIPDEFKLKISVDPSTYLFAGTLGFFFIVGIIIWAIKKK